MLGVSVTRWFSRTHRLHSEPDPAAPAKSDYSDGSPIYQIANGGLWADRPLSMAMVGSSSVTKLSPREWDITLLLASRGSPAQWSRRNPAAPLRRHAPPEWRQPGSRCRRVSRWLSTRIPRRRMPWMATMFAELAFLGSDVRRRFGPLARSCGGRWNPRAATRGKSTTAKAAPRFCASKGTSKKPKKPSASLRDLRTCCRMWVSTTSTAGAWGRFATE